MRTPAEIIAEFESRRGVPDTYVHVHDQVTADLKAHLRDEVGVDMENPVVAEAILRFLDWLMEESTDAIHGEKTARHVMAHANHGPECEVSPTIMAMAMGMPAVVDLVMEVALQRVRLNL